MHTTGLSAESQDPPQNHFSALIDCIPGLSGYMRLPALPTTEQEMKQVKVTRGVAMSGTGNGDSFLRLAAVRTAAAMARFSSQPDATRRRHNVGFRLQSAVSAVAGPNGMLQQSAEDRWLKTGEGEGGIIGIDLVNGRGEVVFDYNCGGMFHCWVDGKGKTRFQVFKDEVDI